MSDESVGSGAPPPPPYEAPPPPPPTGQGLVPPSDPELLKRIDKLAQYVAKNTAMEDMVRGKQAGNPDFAFLDGGEGAEYRHGLHDRVADGGEALHARVVRELVGAGPPDALAKRTFPAKDFDRLNAQHGLLHTAHPSVRCGEQ